MSSRSSSNSSSASSRGTSPAGTQSSACSCCSCAEEFLKNSLFFNIAIAIFAALCCIILSFNLPADYQKKLSFKAVEDFSTSMESACNILFLLTVVYLVTALIIRKRAGL